MSNLSAQDLPAFSSSNFAVDVNVENEGGGSPGETPGPGVDADHVRPVSFPGLNYHKWMHFLKQIYLSLLLLFVSLTVVLVEVKLNRGFNVPWPVIVLPIWVATLMNTVATIYELKTSRPRRRPRAYLIEHINHMIFWFAVSIFLIVLCLRLSNKIAVGATIICTPFFLALCIQSVMYVFKEKKTVYCCSIPEGFPADPVYVTALFVALRLDQIIMWDWQWVLWCPWLIWLVALVDCVFYSVYFVLYLNRYCREPNGSWGGTIVRGIQYLYNPFWHTFRIGTLWAMATMLVCTLFFVLENASKLMNGDVSFPTISITAPLFIMMIWSACTSLFITFFVKPRLLRREPAKCGVCKKQIRQILRIKRLDDGSGGGQQEGKKYGIRAVVIDHGEEDQRVHKFTRNYFSVLSTTAVPKELWNPPGKSFFLPKVAEDDEGEETDGSNADKEGGEKSRLLPNSSDRHNYMNLRPQQASFAETNVEANPGDGAEDDCDNESFNTFKGYCPICMENVPIDCVFLDCGHNIYCWNCGVDVFARRVQN